MKIAFFGTPPYAAVSLQAFLESAHDVVVAVTRADAPSGRGRRLSPAAVKELALAAGLPVLDPSKPRGEEFLSTFRDFGAELGVVVAYGRMLPTDLLEIPRYGFINAHGSLLPALRGAAPIERAILTGLTETGVSIMAVSEGMDEGDVFQKQTVIIDPESDCEQLRETMAQRSASMLLETVAQLEAGTASAHPQDPQLATYAPPLRREESCLDWNLSAAAASCVVRAFAPRPGAFTFDGSKRLKVLEARPIVDSTKAAAGTVLGKRDQGIAVACGEDSLLLLRVQPEGKQAMSAVDFARGRNGLIDGHRLTEVASNART